MVCLNGNTLSGLLSEIVSIITITTIIYASLNREEIRNENRKNIISNSKIKIIVKAKEKSDKFINNWISDINNAEREKDIAWVYPLFPSLKARSWQLAGTLSGGEQQMLAVARALMSRPKLLMMDEPSLGLAPLIIKDIFNIIKQIHKTGVTILLIEQNANAALHVADKAYVMETGRIIMHGTGKELLSNDDIKHAYLGTKKD